MKEMRLIVIYKEITILLTWVKQMNFPITISKIHFVILFNNTEGSQVLKIKLLLQNQKYHIL